MKKLLTLLLVAGTFPVAGIPEMTPGNVQSLSRKPVIVVTSLGCDAGQMYVNSVKDALSDLKGVDIIWTDVNNLSKVFQDPPVSQIPPILLVKGGVVLDTSAEYHSLMGRANLGSNLVRKWAYDAMTKQGIPFSMDKPPEIFLDIVPDNSPANLPEQPAAYYPLKTDLKEAGGGTDFKIGIKNFPPNGAYYMSGEFGYTMNGKYVGKMYNEGKAFFRQNSPNPLLTGASMSVNIKPEKSAKVESTLFGLGDRRITYFVQNSTGKLAVWIEAYCDKCGPRGGRASIDDAYIFPDVTVEFGKWYTFVVSLDIQNQRLKTLMNGRRLKDMNLSKQFLEINAKSAPDIYAMSLTYDGTGTPFKGFAKDVAIYDRTLNHNEMLAVAAKYGDKTNPPPPATPDKAQQDALDRAMLQAAANGDAAQVSKQLDAGANVNATVQDWSALNIAAFFGREKVVKLLIDRHAAVLHEVQPGWNAQQQAKSKGFDSIVKLLENASNQPRVFGERKFNRSLERAMTPEAPELK